MSQVYKIKKAFITPFIIAVVLLFVLLVLSFVSGQPWEKILIGALFLITLIVAIESYEREILISETGLRIKKFFREKKLTWAEITHLGVVVMRNKVYFLLTTTRGLFILSNLLEDHTVLIGHLANKLGDEKVEPEIKNYLEAPIERRSLVIITWIIVIVIIAIIVTKLLT